MSILFLSDLHLTSERTNILKLFKAFLTNTANSASAVYILGDLFEAWIGDDAIDGDYKKVIDALKRLVEMKVPVHIMHGNRDFLLSTDFEKQSGTKLLKDPTVINLNGIPTLLMHGDTLCTDDTDYQEYRKKVRDERWQKEFLKLTIEQRSSIANHYRTRSQEQTDQKSQDIMDVNLETIINTMKQHNVFQLIHGHTHRQAHHTFLIEGNPAQRFVLGDWYVNGNMLKCEHGQCKFIPLNL